MKKRYLIFALVAAFSFVLAGCKTTTVSTEPEHVHSYGEWEVVEEATCTANGLKSRECACGEIETETISALGHNYVDNVCTRCHAGKLAVNNLEYGEDKDYISLYDKYGSDITIADVKVYTTGEEEGLAYITKDSKDYTLGLDFLTMAMVYNTEVPEGYTGTDITDDGVVNADDVYARWWKFYMLRWNYLLPEVPLYSNEYYDVYATHLNGVSENPTNPYWSVSNALIDWTSTKDKIIIGSTTDLSGKFRFSSFGASSPGASDNDVSGLVSGLSTVCTNKQGNYQWDDTVVKSHTQTENADGTITFTIEINNNLKFSDGTGIKAKDYLVSVLAFSTPVAKEAAGKDHKAGMSYVGYEAFAKYDGTNNGVDGASKYFSGLKLFSDNEYKFQVTVSSDYSGYYYAIAQAAFGPEWGPMWLGSATVEFDENGVYLSDAFYAKSGDSYTVASTIKASSTNTDQTYPYTGAYCVQSYDASKKEATLVKNTYYVGNFEGQTAGITTVVYKKIISATQLADFKAGGVDALAAITGGDATDEALAYAKGADGELGTSDDKAKVTHYSRAGYGKLGFRADYGPAQFIEVRRAIAYCLDRTQFAQAFTGGYGGTVDGPYYSGAWMYQAAVRDGMVLNKYATSLESAVAQLVAGGWIYAADGTAYVSGVRYKKILPSEATVNDINYAAKDGSYETVAIYKSGSTTEVDYYLMPLVINWYGTADNEFSDLLVANFVLGENIKKAGIVVKYTIGDFAPMLDELYQAQVYGYYSGSPTYCAFNFATGFSSAVYDFSYNCTIDPSMYEDYSQWYYKDTADFYMISD